jgi:hypothetical protein
VYVLCFLNSSSSEPRCTQTFVSSSTASAFFSSFFVSTGCGSGAADGKSAGVGVDRNACSAWDCCCWLCCSVRSKSFKDSTSVRSCFTSSLELLAIVGWICTNMENCGCGAIYIKFFSVPPLLPNPYALAKTYIDINSLI